VRVSGRSAASAPSRTAAPGEPRYRWVVLAVGAVAAGTFSALRMGLPALGPAIRDAYALSLTEVGVAFAAVGIGFTVGLVPWGLLTDRIGERPVLAAGLAGSAAALAGAARAPDFTLFWLGLFAAGLLGASATGATGRAVMGWFARSERGFALGIRQMSLPLGGGLGALSLPLLVGAQGLEAALLVLAGLILGSALAAGLLMRDPPPAPAGTSLLDAPPPVRDPRIWRLGAGSALLVVAQAAMLGFLVLYLVDERGVSPELAAVGLAGIMLIGAALRVRAGRASDREERRVQPMRRQAVASGLLLAALAATTAAPDAVVLPLLFAASVATMIWNGLAFTAAAEISGRRRAGTAMSMQNTIVAVVGALTPAAFGALVEATAWPLAFAVLGLGPVAAWLVLRPLVAEEDGRAAARIARLAAPDPRPVEAS